MSYIEFVIGYEEVTGDSIFQLYGFIFTLIIMVGFLLIVVNSRKYKILNDFIDDVL